ncbi:MAG TPA: sulfatase-like hydrolase/transferase [Thermoanaerobaculia bacterium]|nr:sulfatase-like hydrolase/transferase [Thermoanaerobaculia bacterium]
MRFSRAILPILLFLLTACGRGPAPHRGPIVLITLDSMRADVVERLGGEPGLTPRLDELIRQSDWAGRAIASSSWEGSTMATLFTGLRPWQHQVLYPGRAHLPKPLITLAEVLKANGYETTGFFSGPWYDQSFGFQQGFDTFQHYGKGRRLVERLGALSDGRSFTWAHLPMPQAPYIRRDNYLSRLGRMPPQLPRKVMPMQLGPFFDPAVPLPLNQRRRLWALYCMNVAWADEQLGHILDALRASGAWDDTLLVVTANHGEEFGEKGQILHGGNLGRQLIEVPLVIKLPAGFDRKLQAAEGERVAAGRIWATLVEAVGGQAPPAAAPSLFRRVPPAAVSELYLTNGTNRFSLVEGDLQLLWETRFAPPEPEYWLARMGTRSKEVRGRLQEDPKVIFTRLRDAFAVTPPLHGRGAPGLTLERWEERGTREVADPGKTREMAGRLVRDWGAFVPEELPPAQEAGEWNEVSATRKPRRP